MSSKSKFSEILSKEKKREIVIADKKHTHFAPIIHKNILDAIKDGSSMAERFESDIRKKIFDGNAVMATEDDSKLMGFCYISPFENDTYVSVSALIIPYEYRGMGMAELLKKYALKLSKSKFPDAKVFGLTTNKTVVNINKELGYKIVPYSKITKDEMFWRGCESCKNYEILKKNNFKQCRCVAMLCK